MNAAAALARLLPHQAALGVTRLADLTGLDRVGLPVAMAVRPLGRLLAVNQGKGLTLEAAKVSALFEAAEQAAAERHALPLYYGTAAEQGRHGRLADCGALPLRRGSPFTDRFPMLWTVARQLADDGSETLVPYELVHCDFTFPQPAGSGCFVLSTNGLGAGFDREQAVEHALLETIERDQQSLATLRADGGCIDLATIENEAIGELLGSTSEAGLLVVAQDLTGDLGVPTISCRVMDRSDDAVAMAHAAEGSASRADPEAALLAALSEALQSRLAFISGTRDDLHPADYEPQDRSRERREIEDLVRRSRGGRRLSSIGDRSLRASADLLPALLARLRAAGCGEPLVVEFPPPAPGIHAVRVIVPGLEPPLHPAHALGRRAQAALAQRR